MLYLRAWKKILVLIELAKTPLKKILFQHPWVMQLLHHDNEDLAVNFIERSTYKFKKR